MAAPRPPADDLDTPTHQILNGLTTVRGRAQLLHRHVRRPEPTQPEVVLANLSRIMDAVDQLARLVITLRDRRTPPPSTGAEGHHPPP